MNKRLISLFIVFTAYFSCAWTFLPGGGYKIKTIVIDAGHGGKDPGNTGTGRYKVTEKNVALDVALKVGELIKAEFPEIKVIYTRDKDVFIGLDERARIANDANADLFISIHCNAAKNLGANGTETFVLGLHKTEENLLIAQQENSVIFMEDDYETKYEGFDPNSAESMIALTMMQSAFLNQSIELSSYVQDDFVKSIHREDRGVKQAGFLVLRKTTMPAILIELGFLTNKTDEDFLVSANGKLKMATSIFAALKKYKSKHETADAGVSNSEVENNKTPEQLKTEAAAKAKAEADKKLKEEAELKAKLEAEQKRLMEENAALKAKHAEMKAKEDAELKSKQEAEAKAKADADAKALAEKKIKEDAALKAKQEAEAKAKAEADLKAKQDAENKILTEKKAKEQAELKAKEAADAKAKAFEELTAKLQADKKAKEQADLKAKQESEAKAKADADAKAKEAEELKAKEDAERVAKLKAIKEQDIKEQAAKTEAERNAKQKAEAQALLEEEKKNQEKEQLMAEFNQRMKEKEELEAIKKQQDEALNRIKNIADENAKIGQKVEEKIDAELFGKTEINDAAEKNAAALAEEKAKEEAALKTKQEAEVKKLAEEAKKKAEAKAKLEAEQKAKEEAAQKLKQEAEAKAENNNKEEIDLEEKAKKEAIARIKAEEVAELEREVMQAKKEELLRKIRETLENNTDTQVTVEPKKTEVKEQVKNQTPVDNKPKETPASGKLVFRVQFFGSPTAFPLSSPKFSGIDNIYEYQAGGLHKYASGNFDSIEAATAHQAKVRKQGYPDAFVVAFLNGERIDMAKAKEILNK